MTTMGKASKVSFEQDTYVAGATQQSRGSMCAKCKGIGKVRGDYTGRAYFVVALGHHLHRLSWNLQVKQ